MATPKQTDPQYKLRLTPQLKTRIEEAAEANNRSMNAEIIARLDESFRDPLIVPQYLLDRIERGTRGSGVPVRAKILEVLEEAFPGGVSLGEFLDKWAVPAAKANTAEEREDIIMRSNLRSYGGYYLGMGKSDNGEDVIEVIRIGDEYVRYRVATIALARDEY